jgi:ribosome-associated toxin RatA of RatAB toxin-antitoxin module
MKTSLIVLGVLVALIGAAVAAGALLPVKHTVTRTKRIQARPEQVWAAITAVEAYREWREVTVELLPPRNGHRMWREIDRHNNAITFEATEEHAPERLVTTIADRKLPFGGSWTWQLAPAPGDACDVTITENGEIYNPLFRFMARFIFGYTATIDGVLAGLDQEVRGAVVR